jgi:predicted metal-dependent hydrolase
MKRINIRISQTGRVTVSAPRETPDRQIVSTVAAKRSWVLRHLESLEQSRERNNPLRNLLLRGQSMPVTLRPGRRRRGKVLEEDGIIVVQTLSGSDEESLKTLESWLTALAREELSERSRAISARLDIPFKRLFLRNQRTRWGSSSGRGNISLNWRIIMTPPPIRDYLIVHELCHQRQLNHSPAYWTLVRRYYPDYRKAEEWLKANRGIMGLFR